MSPVPDESDLDPRWTTSTRMAAVPARRGTAGPYDADDPDVPLPVEDGALDFGSLRVPMPARAQLQVEKGSGELLRAVHVLVPSGRVSLSALAAPRSSPLWRELADEIAGSLSGDGARVRSEWGEWGREVQAGSNGALSRFIGVDGPRWMLYGVATGPADSAAELSQTLREMIYNTVVTRGPDPLPVKTVLPLRLPEDLEELVEEAREQTALRPGDDGALVQLDRQAASGLDAAPGDEGVRPAGQAEPAHHSSDRPGTEPRAVPEFGEGLVERSIGIRRSELRPVARQFPPSAEPGRAPARHGLPPVPSVASMDTDGFPRVPLVETTWSMAIPVVSSDQVEDQPGWAELDEAPSYWPSPYLPRDTDEAGRPAYASDEFGMSPGEVVPEPAYRRELDDLGFGLPPTGLDPLPGEPGGPPLAPAGGHPDPLRVPAGADPTWAGSGWPAQPHRAPVEPHDVPVDVPVAPYRAPVESPRVPFEPHGTPERQLPFESRRAPVEPHRAPAPHLPFESHGVPLESVEERAPGGVHDSLHDALTSDAAVTQDRLPKVPRRARHRRPD